MRLIILILHFSAVCVAFSQSGAHMRDMKEFGPYGKPKKSKVVAPVKKLTGAQVKTKPAPAPETTSTVASNAGPPIEIGIKDLLPQKEQVLADAKNLAATGATMRDTQDYVRRFIAYSKAIGALGLENWTDAEKALLVQVPEPSAAALQLYMQEKLAAEQRVQDKIEAAERERHRAALQRLYEEQLEQQQKQAEESKALKEREVAAQERQADAAESQAVAAHNQAAATQNQANATTQQAIQQAQFNRLLKYGY